MKGVSGTCALHCLWKAGEGGGAEVRSASKVDAPLMVVVLDDREQDRVSLVLCTG